MYRRSVIALLLLAVAVGVFALAALSRGSAAAAPDPNCERVDRPARLQPDYGGSAIPPNIAPLNFAIREPGVAFRVRLSSRQGDAIEIGSRDGVIKIPPQRWRSLLEANRGQTLCVDVFVRDPQGRWRQFPRITNLIAPDDIDECLVYRKMNVTHLHTRSEIAIYCRQLSSFRESVVLSSRSYEGDCVNCHTFCRNCPDQMLMGVRSEKYGNATLLVSGGVVRRLEAKFGYTSWHPSGRLAVYAVNNIPMVYHTAQNEMRDTVDLDSLLAVFHCDQGRAEVVPKLAQKEWLETWPAWSGDGKYLYFCRAPKLWPAHTVNPPLEHEQVKYDLVRIAYDITTDTWGQIETVLSAQQAGKSIGMPHVSPDGRWLSCCLFDYGYFPTWKQESDLYLIDLQAPHPEGQFPCRRLEINSDQSESWHTWSSNSRWLVFSSKRLQGIFTRLFLSYVDADGKVYQPLLLPQEDPGFYESCLLTYNTPELVSGPPQAVGEALAGVFRRGHGLSVSIPQTMATPSAAQAPPAWSGQGRHE